MSLRRFVGFAISLALCLLFASAIPTAYAASIVVNSLADTTGACATSGSGTCTLRDAITYANSTAEADTITFGGSGTITLGSSLPAIQNTLTIDGTGITVDANSNSKILSVTNTGALTLTGLTLTNGQCSSSQNDFGAGIVNRGTLNVTGTTFSGNQGCKGGGGIANYRTATVTNSTFSKNGAVFGGGISNENGTLTVTGSTFTGNDASPPFGTLGSGYGGGIWNDHDATLKVQKKSTFSNNSANTTGGGIASIGQATVSGSTFSNNTASTGGGLANGVDISSSGTLTVKNTQFSNNSAGTGAALSNQGVTLNVQNSTFSDNGTTTYGYGGGVYNSSNGTTTVNNSTLSKNNAKLGGGLYNDSGTLNVTNSTLTGNTGWGDGGGMYNNTGALVVTNSTLTGNSAKTLGNAGGIYNLNGTVTVTNSTIYGNDAAFTSLGAGIVNYGTSFVLYNTIVANNQHFGYDCSDVSLTLRADAYNIDSDNSCDKATTKTVAQLAVGPLQNNGGPTETMALGVGSAAIDAGDDAVCAAAPVNNLDQRGVARPQGTHCDPGAYEYDAQFGPNFIVNDSPDTDDGLCSLLVPGFSSCTLREAINAANAFAGADNITFDIPAGASGCTAANQCTITLTAPLPAINTNLVMDGSANNGRITIDGANAHRALTVNGNKTFQLTMLSIVNGKCDSDGESGGIVNSGTLNVTDSSFSGASGSNSGISNYGTLNVANSSFSGNTACAGGGAAINNSGSAAVTNTAFSGNSADGLYGGGIYNQDALLLTNSTLNGNSAEHGGGIFSNQGTVIIANSTLSGNNAQSGGGIFIYAGTLTMTNSTISGNDSPIGGGITNVNGTLVLRNSIVALNISSDCLNDGTLNAGKSNLDSDGSCGNAVTKNEVELALGPLKNNGGPTQTIKPGAKSAAIGAGKNETCAAPVGVPDYGAGGVDQRGVKRPQGANCDVGAFEVRVK